MNPIETERTPNGSTAASPGSQERFDSDLIAKAEPAAEIPVWNATLTNIFISPGHDYWGRLGEGRFQNGIQSVDQVHCVTDRGLVGDRYYDERPGRKGQVTFFDADVVDQVRREFRLPKLPASVFRRNLIVRGVRLSEFLGREFEFQGIVFEGSQECTPCHWMSRVVADGTEAFLKQGFRGGLRAKIKTDGILRIG